MADKDDIIYLESDEDITSAIDKLNRSEASSIQIVTPKRSALFQSVINMKLIKKAADDASKKLVVVTNDRLATNIAGRIGLPVASQVGEAPKVPSDATSAVTGDEEIEESEGSAGPAPKPEPAAVAEEPKPAPTPPVPATKPGPAAPKAKRIPNFNRLQRRILWVTVGVAAILGLIGLNFFLTTAHVTLAAKATKLDASFDLTADPSVGQSNVAGSVLAASQLTEDKTITATVPATGTKDVGTKAHGNMVVSNCYDNQPHTLVAGTRFAAPDGKIFRSDSDATVPGGAGSFFGCTTPGKVTVAVTADQNGDAYNLGDGTKYTIPALPSGQQAGITGTGGQMSGGTSKTVQVLTQGDVDKAQKAELDKAQTDIKKDLIGKAKGQQVIDASFDTKVTSSTPSPAVGEETPQSKLTIQVTYSELAVNKDELSQLAKSQETKAVGAGNQIYDDGMGSATYTKGTRENSYHATAAAYYGPKIDTASLAKQLKGKRYGDATDLASKVPGVDRADITLSPGWATGMPLITSHIHIDIKASKSTE